MTSANKYPPLILGFDIGGTKTAVVLGDLEGQVHARDAFTTPADQPFETALRQMLACADALIWSAQAQGLPQPLAVSAAVGGPLDIERGIIFSPPHLPTWDRAPLKESLEAHFALPARVEHDGNAGALAETYFGAGRGARSLVYLTMGTGMGAGIILDGRIVHGATDTAGEVGHMRIAEDGPLEYGKAGSWEGYCSGSGLQKQAALRYPGRWPGGATTAEIVQAALAGDEAALDLVVEMGEWLGRGLAVLVDVLNPEVIVVGTLGVVLGDLVLEPARRILQQEALPLPAQACRVVPGALGASLGDVGALMAVIDAVRQGHMALDEPPRSPSLALVLDTLEAGIEVRRRTIVRLAEQIAQTGQALIQALQAGRKVLAFGNGGSAAAAQHLAGELAGRYKAERPPLPGLALTADSSLVTCIGNDYGFEEVFARQLQALAAPGDVAIGFTTSGRSVNVLRGLSAAQARGAVTIALTGEAGLIGLHADHVLAAPSPLTARIQEEHDAIIHAWCEMIDRVFAAQ
jgi:predicted NBD/HSP70 family sugar kinase